MNDLAPIVLIAFLAGLAGGLWLAVICQPRAKVAEKPVEEEDPADWWRDGREQPEWEP